MEQLKAHRSMLGGHRHLSVVLCHEQDKHRAHALAATLTNMLQGALQQSVAIGERLVEKCDEIEQIMLNRLFDEFQVIHNNINFATKLVKSS